MKKSYFAKVILWISLFIICPFLLACQSENIVSDPMELRTSIPLQITHNVQDSLTQKITFVVDNPNDYAALSVYADDVLLIDNLNIPRSGEQTVNAVTRFEHMGNVSLRLEARGSNITINKVELDPIPNLYIPRFKDISALAGLEKASSIKYGGPTIADIDNDGDYDFIVNNHNAENSKLYWNNGDGTVTKHKKNLSRWFMHDVHGTAAGDYDNDGDLDIVVTQGGGNGTDPSKANFYNNNNGTLVLMTGDVGIDRGGRGRGAKWSDMDIDGDLDLILFNETSLAGDKPQHFFYENKGDGTFNYRSVAELEDELPSRMLLTDFNDDNIDDVVLYGHGPLTLWQGNGDFSFQNVTHRLPKNLANLEDVLAATDIDIDNDGDFDLYFAKGNEFGLGGTPSLDHDPITKELSIKPRGLAGTDMFDFTADGAVKFHKYYFLAQGIYRGQDYPMFLGAEKSRHVLASGEGMDISPSAASGWPEDISQNGIYFGHLGDGQWKAALVREGDVFWGFNFSLSGVSDVTPSFTPFNRNITDTLLRNDGDSFTDVSQSWNLPRGGNALGVTTGDFNNDSHQDLFVYRWGYIGNRISDYMLLNTGAGNFETVTIHGANDVGGPGNGDMGQAFDFDLDGNLELLNGSEGGEWYLYSQSEPLQGNHALVRVGYAPLSNVDAISAEVVLKTKNNEYRKRVGSAGAVFSQSLLNIVHFGLGAEEQIESIDVRWRNGEKTAFTNVPANALYDTNQVSPKSLNIDASLTDIRQGTSLPLTAKVTPVNAKQDVQWSSSEESILTVDDKGVIKAVGEAGQKATITLKTADGGVITSRDFSIIKWSPAPVISVEIKSTAAELIQGQTLRLGADFQPPYADEAVFEWMSSNPNIISVDQDGNVKALKAGRATILLAANDSPNLNDHIEITVPPKEPPFIRISNAETIANTTFKVGDTVTLNVEYHAGTGNEVIASDEGGVRFWLRHFKSEWIPEKDITLIDRSAVGTVSGQSSKTFSLQGMTPTKDLPPGHFYYLRASFATSDGSLHEQAIYPIKIR